MPATTRRTTFLRAVSRSWLGIGVFAVAAAEAIWVARPFSIGSVGSDSTSTVLYFDRIVSGEQLELFLGTTAKPLSHLSTGRSISRSTAGARYRGLRSSRMASRSAPPRCSWAGCRARAGFTATGLLASTGLLLVPLLANPLRGLWVLRIEPQA
jgi:hypothetical protein